MNPEFAEQEYIVLTFFCLPGTPGRRYDPRSTFRNGMEMIEASAGMITPGPGFAWHNGARWLPGEDPDPKGEVRLDETCLRKGEACIHRGFSSKL